MPEDSNNNDTGASQPIEAAVVESKIGRLEKYFSRFEKRFGPDSQPPNRASVLQAAEDLHGIIGKMGLNSYQTRFFHIQANDYALDALVESGLSVREAQILLDIVPDPGKPADIEQHFQALCKSLELPPPPPTTPYQEAMKKLEKFKAMQPIDGEITHEAIKKGKDELYESSLTVGMSPYSLGWYMNLIKEASSGLHLRSVEATLATAKDKTPVLPEEIIAAKFTNLIKHVRAARLPHAHEAPLVDKIYNYTALFLQASGADFDDINEFFKRHAPPPISNTPAAAPPEVPETQPSTANSVQQQIFEGGLAVVPTGEIRTDREIEHAHDLDAGSDDEDPLHAHAVKAHKSLELFANANTTFRQSFEDIAGDNLKIREHFKLAKLSAEPGSFTDYLISQCAIQRFRVGKIPLEQIIKYFKIGPSPMDEKRVMDIYKSGKVNGLDIT